MVMYNFLMDLLIGSAIRRDERKMVARYEKIGEEQENRRWTEWNKRRLKAVARGEPFKELPPSAYVSRLTPSGQRRIDPPCTRSHPRQAQRCAPTARPSRRL
jgi:hypothetical protein